MGTPEDRALGEVASAWPVLVALAAVVGLSLTSIGLDLMIGHQTAVRTAQLIDATGGDCHLSSAPNQGTRVTLHLPAAP
jgi:hypothetical protein